MTVSRDHRMLLNALLSCSDVGTVDHHVLQRRAQIREIICAYPGRESLAEFLPLSAAGANYYFISMYCRQYGRLSDGRYFSDEMGLRIWSNALKISNREAWTAIISFLGFFMKYDDLAQAGEAFVKALRQEVSVLKDKDPLRWRYIYGHLATYCNGFDESPTLSEEEKSGPVDTVALPKKQPRFFVFSDRHISALDKPNPLTWETVYSESEYCRTQTMQVISRKKIVNQLSQQGLWRQLDSDQVKLIQDLIKTPMSACNSEQLTKNMNALLRALHCSPFCVINLLARDELSSASSLLVDLSHKMKKANCHNKLGILYGQRCIQEFVNACIFNLQDLERCAEAMPSCANKLLDCIAANNEFMERLLGSNPEENIKTIEEKYAMYYDYFVDYLCEKECAASRLSPC